MLERIHKGGLSPEDCIRDAKDKANPFRLFGFGHRVYRNYDPRAKILKEACDKVFAQLKRNDPLLDIARKLEELALEDPYFIERKLYPNVDFYSGIILRAHGHSHQHVHGLLRHRPVARLDRPVEGAARRSDEQDPPSPADLHRPHGDRLRADEGTRLRRRAEGGRGKERRRAEGGRRKGRMPAVCHWLRQCFLRFRLLSSFPLPPSALRLRSVSPRPLGEGPGVRGCLPSAVRLFLEWG